MKRQAGGATSGGGPTDAIDVMTEPAWPADTAYASAADTLGGAELLEDRSVRIAGGGHGRRFGLSVPGAIVGSFLVAALALGAAMGPLSGKPSGAGHEGDTAIVGPTDKAEGTVDGDAGGAQEPDGGETESTDGTDGSDGTEKPDGGETEPTDGAEPTKAPAPDATELEIGAAVDGTAVVVEWSACKVDGFVAYKVIRSKDEHATWPLGAGDSLAAAIGEAATTRFVDKGADAGRTYTYRVVGLRSWNGETVIGCSTLYAVVTTPAPTPKPDSGGDAAIALTVVIKENHPFLDWTACSGVDFDFYKVVRSSDSTVTWPVGDNDSKVAAIGKDGETKFWDGNAPAGKKLYYRVFCIRETEAGHVAVGASPVKAIQTPAGEPAPAPKVLGFEAGVTGEGVVLTWAACGVDNFAYYKVVRSTTNENPSYFPWTDGTEPIGVIESQSTTQFVDGDVASGQTIYYRVQCLGYWNGEKTLRGQTAVVAVTIP